MIQVAVVVPTISGREASYERLVRSLEPTSGADLELETIRDAPTCGAGWLEGMKRSRAPYLFLCPDDLEMIRPDWALRAAEAVDRGRLPCPRVFRPDGSIESQGGDMSAWEHLHARPRKDWEPCDFTTVPFMSREQADEVGMIDTQYAGDVWVSYRGRQLGIETVLRHGFDLVHHQEQVGRGAGMPQSERDAMDVATMRRELERCES